MVQPTHFDPFAENYEALVTKNVRRFGEPASYFARYKLARIQGAHPSTPPRHILDIGCGVGLLTELLGQSFPASQVIGLECSGRSVEQTAARCAQLPNVRVQTYDGQRLPEHVRSVDLAILANVLHHVQPKARGGFLRDVVCPALVPGARVMVFEHNPYNPLTQMAVQECAFDRGVQLLTRGVVYRLLTDAGLHVIRQDYIVFFPRWLRALRSFEERLGRMPLGAQHLTVARWAGDRS